MVLIFVHKITARKEYIFRHIFKRLLEYPYQFTSDLSEFIGHAGPKFSYGNKPLGDEFFIKSYGLLAEVGIDDHEIDVQQWKGLPIFFKSQESADLPFDIFSASFYLLTRYEEYLPQVKDHLGRFSASTSIAAQNNFLQKPVVDLWILKFKEELEKRFEITLSRKRETNIIAAIETATVYKYRHRSIFPLITMFYKSAFRLKFKELFNEVGAVLGITKDPYDIYDILLRVYKESIEQLPARLKYYRKILFFFHLGDYNSIDDGVSYRNRSYQELIKHLSDYVNIGLRFSYNNDQDKIKKEIHRFESLTNRRLEKTMTAFSKISMPGHYKNVVDIEMIEDYSMGYTNAPGYRASTSHSFYFYDLDYEVQTPLKVVPYALHYGSIEHYMLNGQQAIVDQLLSGAAMTSGNFIILFDNAQLDLKKRSHIYTIIKKMLTYHV